MHPMAPTAPCGLLRITADRREIDVNVTQKMVALAMREPGIAGICPRAFVVKTMITEHGMGLPPFW